MRNRLLMIFAVGVYLVLITAYAAWEYRVNSHHLLEAIDHRLLGAANAIPFLLPADYLDRAADPDTVPREEWHAVADRIEAYLGTTDFIRARACIRTRDFIQIVAVGHQDKDARERSPVPPFGTYAQPPPALVQALDAHTPRFATHSDESGQVRAVFVPVRAPSGTPFVVTMKIDIGHVQGALRESLFTSLLTALVLLLVPIPLYLIFLGRLRTHLRALNHSNAELDANLQARQQAEQDLLEERNRLRNSERKLLEAQRVAQVGMWELDFPSRKVRCSQVLLDILGLQSTGMEIDVDEAFALTHPADRVDWETGLRTAIAEGSAHKGTYRIIRPDKRLVWLYTETSQPTLDEKGKPRYLLGISQNITQLKRQEQALRQRMEFLNHLPPNMYYFRGDSDGRLTDVSGGIVSALGYTPDEFIARYPDCLADDNARAVAARHTATSRTGVSPPPYTVSILHKTGARQWIEIQEVPVFDANGDVIAVEGLGANVTTRKEAEDRLQESEERFRLLLNDTPMVAVQGYTADRRIKFWNAGSQRIYGFSAQEAIGQDIAELIVPPELREFVIDAIDSMARTGIPIPPSELELTQKDGTRAYVFTSHAVIPQRPGRPRELFSFDVDLTPFREAEEERHHLQNQLAQAQKMESIGRLAGGIAHDFNNMLGVILGRAELALNEVPEASSVQTDLEQIRDAATRSAKLTRQLLTFARGQAVSPQRLDLNDTIESMLKMLRRLIGEHIALHWDPAPEPILVFMDPAQVDQLLANLIVNAGEAISGAGNITIETAAHRHPPPTADAPLDSEMGPCVGIIVRDDGAGMTDEVKRQVFEPFFTTKEAGTGLGLATVYGIVRQNRGSISVESEPGAGTTFQILLPAHANETTQDAEKEEERGKATAGHETILIVEDESTLLELSSKMLENAGYRVISASSPAEALQYTTDHPREIDLVLTDIIMPGMNGRDLVSNIVEQAPEVRYLFMSGYGKSVIADFGIDLGDDDFIHKPFTQEYLVRTVRTVLDR